MDPCPDESCSPQIPRQPSVQERKDSFSYSWHQGELQEQPNHAIAKLLLTHWEFWICFHIKFGYQYTCPLPAHLSFFRHVELLLNSIKKMDVQYDECNTAMAQGEVNGFDMKLPSWKKYVKRILLYSSVLFGWPSYWILYAALIFTIEKYHCYGVSWCFPISIWLFLLIPDSYLMPLRRWRRPPMCTDLRAHCFLIVLVNMIW